MHGLESSERVRGPSVWLGMDQRELDDAYDQAVYAPNREQVLRRWAVNGEEALRAIGAPDRQRYGRSDVEQLDIYATERAGAPVEIFVHGGGWRGTRAADYGMLGEIFVRAGAHLIVPDFSSVAEQDGNLLPLMAQLRRAVGWVYRNARRFGGDPDRLYVTGHSSGAHLGGCLVTTDWTAEGLPADVLKGALLASGMYDLTPVRLSKRSEYVTITDEIEIALSPIRHLDRLAVPLVVAYGTCETPEFQRQSRDFVAAVEAAGKPASLLVAEAYNHFEILETLASPYGLLGRAALVQMGLGPG